MDYFKKMCDMLAERKVEIPIKHCSNSAGIVDIPEANMNMVRAGIILYGLWPSNEVNKQSLDLRPVMSLKSHISYLKELEAGRKISYGGTYETTEKQKIATVPVGYADGYRRSLSGKFYCLVHGKKAPILGRICMDQMMVDVTHIPQTKPGDRVTLVGTDGEETITMEQVAAAADSFNYEFVCGISRRVPRIYVSGGENIHSVHYLTDPFE